MEGGLTTIAGTRLAMGCSISAAGSMEWRTWSARLRTGAG